MTEPEIETVDLLAALARSIERHKAANPRPAEPPDTVAKRQATITARRLATGYRPGDRCRVVGTVRRYGGRSGRVVTTWLGEVGVAFGSGDQTEAWFRPDELTHLR